MMERQNVPSVICFNKMDIASEEEEQKLRTIYENCGCQVLFTSAAQEEGMENVRSRLRGKTTTVAGPSGVGKSSIINLLAPDVGMETGEISQKIDRGKHTTRHLQDLEKEELKDFFAEFKEYEPYCRFQGCAHINEPGCGVKAALEEGKISLSRYENYVELYNELKDKRRY